MRLFQKKRLAARNLKQPDLAVRGAGCKERHFRMDRKRSYGRTEFACNHALIAHRPIGALERPHHDVRRAGRRER